MNRRDLWMGLVMIVVGWGLAFAGASAAELRLRASPDPVAIDLNDARTFTTGSVIPFRIGYGWGVSGLEYDADDRTCHAFGDMEMAARMLYEEVRKTQEREAAAWARVYKAEAEVRRRDTNCGPPPRMPIELMEPGRLYLGVRP